MLVIRTRPTVSPSIGGVLRVATDDATLMIQDAVFLELKGEHVFFAKEDLRLRGLAQRERSIDDRAIIDLILQHKCAVVV